MLIVIKKPYEKYQVGTKVLSLFCFLMILVRSCETHFPALETLPSLTISQSMVVWLTLNSRPNSLLVLKGSLLMIPSNSSNLSPLERSLLDLCFRVKSFFLKRKNYLQQVFTFIILFPKVF